MCRLEELVKKNRKLHYHDFIIGKVFGEIKTTKVVYIYLIFLPQKLGIPGNIYPCITEVPPLVYGHTFSL
jgi:hypothetical protein